MAAWLWNKCEEYALSHAIFKWLYAEALAVGDTEAIELGHRNCSLAVPTRLGKITDQDGGGPPPPPVWQRKDDDQPRFRRGSADDHKRDRRGDDDDDDDGNDGKRRRR